MTRVYILIRHPFAFSQHNSAQRIVEGTIVGVFESKTTPTAIAKQKNSRSRTHHYTVIAKEVK